MIKLSKSNFMFCLKSYCFLGGDGKSTYSCYQLTVTDPIVIIIMQFAANIIQIKGSFSLAPPSEISDPPLVKGPNSLLRDIFPSPSEINMLKAAEKRTEQKWNNPQLVLFPREAVAKLRQSCMHSCAALGFDTPTIC